DQRKPGTSSTKETGRGRTHNVSSVQAHELSRACRVAREGPGNRRGKGSGKRHTTAADRASRSLIARTRDRHKPFRGGHLTPSPPSGSRTRVRGPNSRKKTRRRRAGESGVGQTLTRKGDGV